LIVAGTPETVSACEKSHTGRALRDHLKAPLAGPTKPSGGRGKTGQPPKV
jgi:hypothetical protein